MARASILVFGLCLTSAMIQTASAENWPGWRGPTGDGISRETSIPTKWSPTSNIAWRTPLPENGHSSPIVWEDRVFVIVADLAKTERQLRAFDRRTGKPVWQQVIVAAPLEGKHKLNSYASGTPVTDGKRIFCCVLSEKEMVAAAFDIDGNPLWSVRPGKFSSVHGFCTSPILYKDLVIFNGDHDGESYLVALKQTDGTQVWKTMREHKTRSYVTPIIRTIEGREQMMLSGSKCIASYDPATGTQHWEYPGPTQQFVASPVYHQGLLVITGGFPDKHIVALKPNGSGMIDASFEAWHIERKGVSYVPSPVGVGDYYVIPSDEGLGTCIDIKTGERLWQERLGRHFSSSLVVANNLIYFFDDDGLCKIVKPGKTFELVAENETGEGCFASPAISQGQIILRTDKSLLCIGETNQASSLESLSGSGRK